MGKLVEALVASLRDSTLDSEWQVNNQSWPAETSTPMSTGEILAATDAMDEYYGAAVASLGLVESAMTKEINPGSTPAA